MVTKRDLREDLRARRGYMSAQWGHEAGFALCAHALRFFQDMPSEGTRVAGYWPLIDEINALPLMYALAERGYDLSLPVVTGRTEPLIFRAWTADSVMEEGPYRTRHPASVSPEVTPDVLLVPLLGFDLRGGRLGQGAGHYDRTLEALETIRGAAPMTLGLAFEDQRIDTVPCETHDRFLNAVATEAALHVFNRR